MGDRAACRCDPIDLLVRDLDRVHEQGAGVEHAERGQVGHRALAGRGRGPHPQRFGQEPDRPGDRRRLAVEQQLDLGRRLGDVHTQGHALGPAPRGPRAEQVGVARVGGVQRQAGLHRTIAGPGAGLGDARLGLLQAGQGALALQAGHLQVDHPLQAAVQQRLDALPGGGHVAHVRRAAGAQLLNASLDGGPHIAAAAPEQGPDQALHPRGKGHRLWRAEVGQIGQFEVGVGVGDRPHRRGCHLRLVSRIPTTA